MRTIKLKQHFSKEEIINQINQEKEIRYFQEWQIILSIINNINATAEDIASFLCCKKRKVYETVRKYNQLGRKWHSDKKWGGRRKNNEYMSIEEEKTFFKELEEVALKGQILTYKSIKKIIENKLNKEVSDNYIWLLFKRNNWVKNQPRPHHPARNIEEQNDFKKNIRRIWQPKN